MNVCINCNKKTTNKFVNYSVYPTDKEIKNGISVFEGVVEKKKYPYLYTYIYVMIVIVK